MFGFQTEVQDFSKWNGDSHKSQGDSDPLSNNKFDGFRALRAQRNKCVKLLQEAKIKYGNKLDTKNFCR